MSSQRVTLQSLGQELLKISQNMVTKEHFDNEMKSLGARVEAQDAKLENMDQRLNKVENDTKTMPRNLYEELHDQEIRKKNIIIFGLKEASFDSNNKKEFYLKEQNTVSELISALGILSVLKIRTFRLGKRSTTAQQCRPLKVTFESSTIRDDILINCHHLKDNDLWEGISITPDLTKMQQKTCKEKRLGMIEEAAKKNSELSEADTGNGIKYKVVGHYNAGTLKIIKTTTSNPA